MLIRYFRSTCLDVGEGAVTMLREGLIEKKNIIFYNFSFEKWVMVPKTKTARYQTRRHGTGKQLSQESSDVICFSHGPAPRCKATAETKEIHQRTC